MYEEVEHDVDVEGARHEHPEAVRLDELHVGHERTHGDDGGVETLDVAHLQDASPVPCEGHEAVRVGERHGDGLFDHHVGTPREKLFRHFRVRGGRRRDDNRASARVQKLLHGASPHEALRSVRGFDCPGRGVVSVDEADGLRTFELRQDPRVVPAEIAAADDACADLHHA